MSYRNIEELFSDKAISILRNGYSDETLELLDLNFDTFEELLRNSEYINLAIENGCELNFNNGISKSGVQQLGLKTKEVKIRGLVGYFYVINFLKDPTLSNFFYVKEGMKNRPGYITYEFNLNETCSGVNIWETEELINRMNRCPICKKDVGAENMYGYPFAGYCCEDCIEEELKDLGES